VLEGKEQKSRDEKTLQVKIMNEDNNRRYELAVGRYKLGQVPTAPVPLPLPEFGPLPDFRQV
jgi:hypothetical protein